MFRRKVQAPDGEKWTLGRRWLPRRRRLGRARMRDRGDGSWLDFGGADDLGAVGVIIAVIVAVIVTVFLALLLFNVVAIAIELLLVILIALAGVIGRVVFRRPWIVTASSGGTRLEWPVVGYFNSRAKIEEIAGQIASGARLEAPRRDGR
jgi:hypothetical protein